MFVIQVKRLILSEMVHTLVLFLEACVNDIEKWVSKCPVFPKYMSGIVFLIQSIFEDCAFQSLIDKSALVASLIFLVLIRFALFVTKWTSDSGHHVFLCLLIKPNLKGGGGHWQLRFFFLVNIWLVSNCKHLQMNYCSLKGISTRTFLKSVPLTNGLFL